MKICFNLRHKEKKTFLTTFSLTLYLWKACLRSYMPLKLLLFIISNFSCFQFFLSNYKNHNFLSSPWQKDRLVSRFKWGWRLIYLKIYEMKVVENIIHWYVMWFAFSIPFIRLSSASLTSISDILMIWPWNLTQIVCVLDSLVGFWFRLSDHKFSWSTNGFGHTIMDNDFLLQWGKKILQHKKSVSDIKC